MSQARLAYRRGPRHRWPDSNPFGVLTDLSPGRRIRSSILTVKTMIRSARGTRDAPGVNVAAKRGLNRAISAQGWSMLRRRLTDKATTCGVTVNADVNAATNILAAGLAVTARGGTSRRSRGPDETRTRPVAA